MIMVLEEKTRPFKKIARNFIAQKNNYWWNYGCLLVRGTCLWLTVAAVLGRLSQLVLDKQRYMWFLVPGHENFVQERLNLCEFSAHWSYLVASRQFLINWLHKLCCFKWPYSSLRSLTLAYSLACLLEGSSQSCPKHGPRSAAGEVIPFWMYWMLLAML